MLRSTSHADDTRFSLRHFPAAYAAVDRHFFSVSAVFRSQLAAKNIAGLGLGTLVSVGFF